MKNSKDIENTSQEIWKKTKVFQTTADQKKPKYYVLDMFPYPSGDGLHVGHIKGYFATDVISNYMRLKGCNVLHPMGWDAFGLPAENYAIKVKKNPREIVKTNVENFKKQMQLLGLSYDWDREINTTDPQYYKWTQWIFVKMFKMGLAYQKEAPINFCPSCKTGLANEEVISGKCERCSSKIQRKNIRQWILKITKYADRLLEDLDKLDWPEAIKEMQRNWIGRSEGANIKFKLILDGSADSEIEVFTTRADTLFGCTYLVISPEHQIINTLKNKIKNFKEVESYINKVSIKSDLDRTDLQKEKTGIILEGLTAINPINSKSIDVWVADYVLINYGTGAVMAVPAHDQRDYEFSKKYSIKIIEVIKSNSSSVEKTAYEGSGKLINSDQFNGLESEQAKKEITGKLEKKKEGSFSVNFKLRDWVFSRQRYWGEPIPIIHCEKCGPQPVDEKDLPVKLPIVESYEPTGTGESPLAKVTDWVNTKCPKCGGDGKRETNTMPQWAGSCWYYLRYIDPRNNRSIIDYDKEKRMMPVDLYVGGAEHAVLHLLYARFWHKVLYDIDSVSTIEPFKKLKSVGLILAPDRQKMSKSRGNVINPDDLVKKYGADSLRLYELFIGPFDQSAVWSKSGIAGTQKFINKVINSFEKYSDSSKHDLSEQIETLGKTISNKIESFSFNTAVSDFMIFTNKNDTAKMSLSNWKDFLIILSPFAPHTCEYLWQKINKKTSIFSQSWPTFTGEISQKEIGYVIQVNGKKRAFLKVGSDMNKNDIIKSALDIENIKMSKYEIKRIIFVKDKIINFVTK